MVGGHCPASRARSLSPLLTWSLRPCSLNHDYIPFPPRPKKSFASFAWEPPAPRIRRPSFVGSRLLSLLHNPALLSSTYHEHNRHSYRANLFASHRISQDNRSLTTGLADIIDSKSQEIRPEDGEVYSKMEDLADELPESSPRFILLSYPLTLVSISTSLVSSRLSEEDLTCVCCIRLPAVSPFLTSCSTTSP